jgi:hypothetical protein
MLPGLADPFYIAAIFEPGRPLVILPAAFSFARCLLLPFGSFASGLLHQQAADSNSA